MTALGDASTWSDAFPEDLVPQILDLIVEAWETFPKPGPTEHEVPITRRFKHAVKQAKTFRRLPVRIEREPAEDDPETGEELGRIDLKFAPAGSAVEEVYFAFECKRVNALKNGRWRSYASQYITEGMMRFVDGQYASTMHHGGMIGYVLNGRIDKSIEQVERNIRARGRDLKMTFPVAVMKSPLRPNNALMRETSHHPSPFRTFRIHHVFLPCPASQGTQTKPRASQA